MIQYMQHSAHGVMPVDTCGCEYQSYVNSGWKPVEAVKEITVEAVEEVQRPEEVKRRGRPRKS